MLTLDEIKAKHGPSQFEIDVPEWGGTVLAKRLTAPDYIAVNREVGGDERSQYKYMIDVIARSLINDDGTPLFTDDSRAVLEESPLLVARLGMEILKRNGLHQDSEKNSEGSQP